MIEDFEQIFILGAPRSGTTFLASLLKLTKYSEPVETHFIPKFFHRLDDYGDLTQQENLSKLISDIQSERAVQQWELRLDIQALCEQFRTGFDYAKLVNLICTARQGDPGRQANCWGDKTPWYLNEPETLASLFPKAKFIYIVRDGRDVTLSLLKKDWGPNNVYACAEYWERLNRPHPCFKKMEDEGRLLRLSYEELITDRAGHIQTFYRFLGQGHLSEQAIASLPKAMEKNSQKWKTEMSPRQRDVFEAVAGNTLDSFNYETSTNARQLGKLSKLLYKAHDKLIWLGFMFKTNIIDGFKIKFMGKEPFAD